MDAKMNIYQRMAAITADLQTVAKNLTVDTGKGRGYKAVSERDIIDAVKPLEAKHGVYSYPFSRETLDAQMLETEKSYNGNTTKRTDFYTRLKTVYRFVNVDNPTEYVDTTVFSVGIDSQDKGDGKAMTYGDKYALMKTYKISTGDDPDQTASEDNSYSAKKEICADCGKEITSGKRRDGTVWPAMEIAAWTATRYKRKLCISCGKAEEARLKAEAQA